MSDPNIPDGQGAGSSDVQKYLLSPSQIVEGGFYALPHEIAFLRKATEQVLGRKQSVADVIGESMDQSSETFHDNAPAEAVHGELYALDHRHLALSVAERNLTLFDYPEPGFELATLGSRVGCLILGDHFQLDITGNLPITLEPDGDVETGSVSAPMPQSLLGHGVGETAEATIHDRVIEITITDIDQLAQAKFYSAILEASI